MAEESWDATAIERIVDDFGRLKAAEKLLKTGPFDAVHRTADGVGYWARCRGLTDDYEVWCRPPAGGRFDSGCTCPTPDPPCKHACALLMHLARTPSVRPAAEGPPAGTADFEALLRNVFENPADDLPRLVFADYVEERGDEARAELVRVQVERGQRVRASAGLRRSTLPGVRGSIERELALCEQLYPEGLTFESCRLTCVRGFLVLSCPGDALRDWGSLPMPVRGYFDAGWVERVEVPRDARLFTDASAALCRRAGVIDLTATSRSVRFLTAAARHLRPGAGDSRVRHVDVKRENRPHWDEVVAKLDRAVPKSPRPAR